MEFVSLKARPQLAKHKQLNKQYDQFQRYLLELAKKKIPTSFVKEVNAELSKLNSISESDSSFRRTFKKTKKRITDRVVKELNYVPIHFYRTLGVAIGMAAFGIPIGLAFAFALQNMAFIGIGIPMGLAVGIAVGTGMDKKAKEEGRQLSIDITAV